MHKKPEYKGRKRCLSNHIYSRWYRPPEVILTEKDYDTSADMWSVGCILGELLKISEPYSSRADPKSLALLVNNRVLFGGTSCFPLSPIENNNQKANVVSIDDQLIKIHKTLGQQSLDDCSFISKQEFLNYNS
jgi:serine/threonine protein kinase